MYKRQPFIIERVTISGGYNFAAKVNKIEDVIISGSMRFLENISGSFSFDLDPYALDSLGRKSNKFYWKTNHQLLRLSSANFSLDARLRSKAVQNTSPTNNTQALPFQKGDYVIYNPDVPYDFSIPWDLGVFYNFNLSQRKSVTTQRDTNVINQTIGVTGNINVTKNWKVAVRTGCPLYTSRCV